MDNIILYQVVATKNSTIKIPIYNKKNEIVGEDKRHSYRTTLLGSYVNRMCADFIKEYTFIKDYGKITINGPIATSNISKEIIETTNKVSDHIHNSIEGIKWLRTYRPVIEEVIEYED